MAADKARLSVEAVEELLGSQALLNQELMALSLESVRQLLIEEVAGRRRQFFLRRLYGRYNKLRYRRELAAVLKGELWPVKMES